MKRFTTRLLTMSFATLAASACFAQFWSLESWGTPTSVSNTGVVAGYDLQEYFLWNLGGSYNNIGGQIPGNGHGGWPSISADGTKVGGTAMNLATSKSEMAQYQGGSWTLLGSLGSSSGDSASAGFAQSSNGTVVAGNAWIDAGNTHAVYSAGGVLHDLGSSIDGRSSRADGVSDDGSVIGGWQDREDGFRTGALWVDGVEQVLMNGSDPLGPIHAVSGDGQWAVGAGGYSAIGKATLWNRSTGMGWIDSPYDPTMYDTVEGWAVSHDGGVVVGFARDTNPLDWGVPDQSWVWTETTGAVTLDEWAVLHGIDTGGAFLSNVTGVSADGRTLIGFGWNSDFTAPINWAMRSEAVPEPASCTVLCLGVAALVRRRFRR